MRISINLSENVTHYKLRIRYHNHTHRYSGEWRKPPRQQIVNNNSTKTPPTIVTTVSSDRVWIMDLETKNFTSKDLSIHSVLPFLPKFEKITAVYQRPSEEIIIIIESEIFAINDKNFQLIRKSNVSETIAAQFNNRKIIGAVNSYAGKTIYFFEDNYYLIINECNFGVEKFGYISKDFIGIPSSIDSVFRYINGMLYFFQNGRYFEYNEFTNSLRTSDKIDLLKFDIQCPNLTLYEQLKELLTRLLLVT